MSFALALPALLAVVGLASDYAMMSKVRGELQAAADAAAIAAAREIPLSKTDTMLVESAAMSFAAYQLIGNSAASRADLETENLAVAAEVVDGFSGVTVTIAERWSPFFAHFLNSDITPVVVSATARFIGRNNICILGLSSKKSAVFLDKNARLTGNNCGVFSDSKDADSLKIGSDAYLKASMACSAGGVSVSGTARVDPVPLSDCPVVEDPLASRPGPSVGSCDHHDLVITNKTLSIDPGVYCGGLKIDGTSKVTFNPGVYVIKDGGLTFAGQATITGHGVGFYIAGLAYGTVMSLNTHISLSAPVEGPLAGLLMFEDRSVIAGLKHRITSDDARTLIGTIYLPRGNLVVDAKKPVADRSAYTAIIAQSIELNMGPNLVLNADYSTTDVPVPAGIAGSSQVILSN